MLENTEEKRAYAPERPSGERELQRARRQCILLGAAALLLAGTQIWQLTHKKNAATEGNSIQVVRPAGEKEGAAKETAGSGADLFMLVNKDHALPEDYQVQLHWLNNGFCAVAEEMYGALKEMLTDGSAKGRQFVVASGYRSSEQQQELLEEDIQASMESGGLTWQEAYEQETRETMPPGYSEHETGLAADIVSLDYQVLDGGQEATAENQWLRENCWRYGFILRYPDGTEEITGISYEPWHFRYVGKEAAREITDRGITLEEYLQ